VITRSEESYWVYWVCV